MKAAVNTRYGSPEVLEIRDVEDPQPGNDEVLVKVHATTVTRSDCGMLRPHPAFVRLFIGLRRPKRTILGMDFAGTVEAVGAGVTRFRPGERVFGMSPEKYGAHAEYLCMSESGPVATMPPHTAFDESVICEGAWYANSCLKSLGLKAGNKILIYGASGAIGTAAVQLAKSRGAEVTAVAKTGHLELLESLGADRAIDYTAQDFTQIGETFDLVLDAVTKTTFFRCRKLLKPDGAYAATDFGPWGQNLFLTIWFALTRSKRVVFPLPQGSTEFVRFLKDRMEAGEFRAVIDRKYPFEKIADAYRYVETGQKTGIVAIDVT